MFTYKVVGDQEGEALFSGSRRWCWGNSVDDVPQRDTIHKLDGDAGWEYQTQIRVPMGSVSGPSIRLPSAAEINTRGAEADVADGAECPRFFSSFGLWLF